MDMKGRALVFALAALAALSLGPACRQKPQASGGPAAVATIKQTTPAPDEIVAEIDGAAVMSSELEQKAKARLARLQQEEYDIRKEALDGLIGDRLIEAEAARRGLSRQALLKAEVDDKVKAPSSAEVDRIYEQYKSRLGGRTREQAGPEIEQSLKRQAEAAQHEAFVQSLRTKAKVLVRLAPPRAEVTFPASAPTSGPADAPITIVGFSDFQCPFCHRAQATIDKIVATYGNKIRLVHRDFPLEGHTEATPAARAARCAGEQGKFWEFHRGLMTEPGDLGASDLAARAKRLSLDESSFGACLGSNRHAAEVKQDLEDGMRAGVSGTPTYFVNGRMITGARPFEAFTEIIEAELATPGR